MGSQLGPIFANFYLGDFEESVLTNSRYVDMFVVRHEHILLLKSSLESSVFHFTYKRSVKGKMHLMSQNEHLPQISQIIFEC